MNSKSKQGKSATGRQPRPPRRPPHKQRPPKRNAQTASTPTNHESGEYPNAAQKRTDDPTRADNRKNTASTDTGQPKAREAYEGRQTRTRPSEQDTETASAPDTTTATTDTGADHRARGTEDNNEEGRGAGAATGDTAPRRGREETKEEKDTGHLQERRQGKSAQRNPTYGTRHPSTRQGGQATQKGENNKHMILFHTQRLRGYN